jgi:hypothetical protein
MIFIPFITINDTESNLTRKNKKAVTINKQLIAVAVIL